MCITFIEYHDGRAVAADEPSQDVSDDMLSNRPCGAAEYRADRTSTTHNLHLGYRAHPEAYHLSR